MNHHPLLAVVC